MERRNFTKSIAGTCLALGSGLSGLSAKTEGLICRRRTIIKPFRLQLGATISLIAPASSVTEEKFLRAQSNLTALGFVVKPGKFVMEKNGYLAGTDQQRLEDLHSAFADPETQAVWCVRGGYGSARMLEMIDYDLIRKKSKVFIGYSDVTALHIALNQRAGLVTYHGPVAAADFTEPTVRHFKHMIMHPSDTYHVTVPSVTDALRTDEYAPFVVRPGKAKGQLTGGNLSLLAALIGSDFAPDYDGKIVFMEDVDEKPYRIDRMLTQLLQGSNLSKANGIVLGVFSGCNPKADEQSWSLKETLIDRLAPLKIPVMYGFPFGHVPDKATFPYGLMAELDTNAGKLTFLESGVA
jgi:muramoyltetrapeptide carboxypeptidase